MANFPGLKMTAAGRELQAKAQTGQLLKFTRVALGDGLPPADPDALVALVNECQTLSVQRQEVPGDGTAVLRVIMTNQGVKTGFYMRELATFAEDPDTGAEVLYSYSNAGDECDFLPAEGAAVVWEGIFDLVTVVGNAENVTAVIDDYITIALKSEVDALKPRLMPAGGTVGQMVRKASNAEGDVEYFDPELDGFDVRLTSVEEPRTAVANQRVFTLQKTVTNGLAVYINGERLSREAWVALSATQLQLNDGLAAGTRVLFVNNEEAGPGRALNVSLTGPTLLYPASSNSFTITDFDSFSVYTATTTVGTVTRDGATLTLDVPADAAEGTLDLVIIRDNVRANYRLPIGAATIAAPEMTAPLQGATDVGFEPDLAAAPFVVYPAGHDSHAETHWQLARDAAFSDLLLDQQGADNLTAISLAALGIRLDPATRYYARARYIGTTLASAWSAAVAFNTAAVYVNKPTFSSPLDGAADVGETPTLTTSAFLVSGGTDNHQSTDWEIRTGPDGTGGLVWSSLGDTANKTSIRVPAGYLQVSTAYYIRARHRSYNYGASDWAQIAVATKSAFLPTTPGEAFGGGYYAGKMRFSDGDYILIVAPKAAEASLAQKTASSATSGTSSYHDGLANSNAMNSSTHPAAQHCRNYTGGGYSDWYLPARDELEVMYRNLKPSAAANITGVRSESGNQGKNANSVPVGAAYTAGNPAQTQGAAFRSGAAEAFNDAGSDYWTSTEYAPNPNQAWRQRFSDGRQDRNFKSDQYLVRPVRRLKI